MVISGLIATGNKDKLMKLAKDEGLNVSDNVLFIRITSYNVCYTKLLRC